MKLYAGYLVLLLLGILLWWAGVTGSAGVLTAIVFVPDLVDVEQ